MPATLMLPAAFAHRVDLGEWLLASYWLFLRVVATITATLPVWFAPSVRLAGVTVQLDSAGIPEHVKAMTPLKVPLATSVSATDPVAPCTNERVDGLADTRNAGLAAVTATLTEAED